MACGATLHMKRSLGFEPIHSSVGRMSAKRRRCMPVTMSSSGPPTKQHQLIPSPFADVVPKLTSDQIAVHLSSEIGRRHRLRRTLFSPPRPNGSTSTTRLQSTVSSLCDVAAGQRTDVSAPARNDVPMFTLKQVSLVCERMIAEREVEIRTEYETALTSKLSEQYEAFLKFNHDQIHRGTGETAASYVS